MQKRFLRKSFLPRTRRKMYPGRWMLDFFIYFGEEMMEKFAQFCFDWNIHDLHDGNIGYHGGVPCLVDYSSYDD